MTLVMPSFEALLAMHLLLIRALEYLNKHFLRVSTNLRERPLVFNPKHITCQLIYTVVEPNCGKLLFVQDKELKLMTAKPERLCFLSHS